MADARDCPDFLGIGGQRCGTGWIFNCLEEHPDLCLPRKEINFFVHADKWERGGAWYAAHFPTAPSALVGEVSSLYLYDSKAPARIHRHSPGVRLFASLRNPLDRALSGYKNLVAAGRIPTGTAFDDSLDSVPEIVQKSHYADGLERFLDTFGPEQMLVLKYEESLVDPKAFIRRICEHIGVDDGFEPSLINARLNVGRVTRSPAADRALSTVGDTLRSVGAHAMLRALKRSGFVAWLRHANTRRTPTELSQDIHSKLLDLFEPEVRRVAALTGLNTDDWLRPGPEDD